MLSVLLITRNEGAGLRPALQRLAAALAPDEDLLAIDLGSEDDTVPQLAAFLAGRAGALIRLDAPGPDTPGPTRAEAMALARGRARHPYLLGLTGQDMVRPAGIAALRALLARDMPQAVVVNRGWWLGAPDVALDPPDAARIAALGAEPGRDGLLRLAPDPARLLLHAGLAEKLGPGTPAADSDPDAGRALWTRALETAQSVALAPEPAWCSPLPERPAAPALARVAALAETGPTRPRWTAP